MAKNGPGEAHLAENAGCRILSAASGQDRPPSPWRPGRMLVLAFNIQVIAASIGGAAHSSRQGLLLLTLYREGARTRMG
jgi:hypothetical protein